MLAGFFDNDVERAADFQPFDPLGGGIHAQFERAVADDFHQWLRLIDTLMRLDGDFDNLPGEWRLDRALAELGAVKIDLSAGLGGIARGHRNLYLSSLLQALQSHFCTVILAGGSQFGLRHVDTCRLLAAIKLHQCFAFGKTLPQMDVDRSNSPDNLADQRGFQFRRQQNTNFIRVFYGACAGGRHTGCLGGCLRAAKRAR